MLMQARIIGGFAGGMTSLGVFALGGNVVVAMILAVVAGGIVGMMMPIPDSWPERKPMRIALDKQFVRRLSEQPEAGMGHQRVDVRFADGRELQNVIVFNAEYAEVPGEFANATIADVRLRE